MNIKIHKDIKIELKQDKNYILVYLKNKIFFKQDYIKNREHTLFLVILILSRFGFVKCNNKNNKDVCV
jgi:hypothetical protein